MEKLNIRKVKIVEYVRKHMAIILLILGILGINVASVRKTTINAVREVQIRKTMTEVQQSFNRGNAWLEGVGKIYSKVDGKAINVEIRFIKVRNTIGCYEDVLGCYDKEYLVYILNGHTEQYYPNWSYTWRKYWYSNANGDIVFVEDYKKLNDWDLK